MATHNKRTWSFKKIDQVTKNLETLMKYLKYFSDIFVVGNSELPDFMLKFCEYFCVSTYRFNVQCSCVQIYDQMHKNRYA